MDDEQKARLTILLAEYSSMRSQIISRGASAMQVAAIGVSALTLVFSTAKDLFIGGGLFIFLLGLVIMLWRLITRDINREASYVRKLEEEINRIAGQELMRWESKYGLAKDGYFRSFWDFTGRSDGIPNLPTDLPLLSHDKPAGTSLTPT